MKFYISFAQRYRREPVVTAAQRAAYSSLASTYYAGVRDAIGMEEQGLRARADREQGGQP